MKYIPNTMKSGNQSRSSSLIINMIFEIADLQPKLKIAICPIFRKFGTQNKSNIVIIDILIGIDDLDPKLQRSLIPKLKCALIFMKFGVRVNRTC